MKLRLGEIEDIDAIYLLESTSFDDNRWTKKQIEYELKGNPCSYVFVLEEEKIFAYIDFWILYEQGEICKIAVVEPLRRKGCGSLLLETALDVMEENGVETINLEVNTSNIGAINLYKKFGFEIVQIKKDYYGSGIDAYQMTRKGERNGQDNSCS